MCFKAISPPLVRPDFSSLFCSGRCHSEDSRSFCCVRGKRTGLAIFCSRRDICECARYRATPCSACPAPCRVHLDMTCSVACDVRVTKRTHFQFQFCRVFSKDEFFRHLCGHCATHNSWRCILQVRSRGWHGAYANTGASASLDLSFGWHVRSSTSVTVSPRLSLAL
jgi:hypothetical protein